MELNMALQATLRRDRVIVLACLTIVVLVSWSYVLAGAGMGMSALDMTAMPPNSQPLSGSGMSAVPEITGGMAMMMMPAQWSLAYAVLMFLMWWIMMIAMMLPSATPMILLFAAINRKQDERGNPYASTATFAFGYILLWAVFSVVAVLLQWGFERAAWLSPMLVSSSAVLGGLLLLAAGIYQLTPIKQACLRYCRSPIHFITSHWRKGQLGALRMGVDHGAYCVGCCWFLMGLLFFGGVMNLYWIGGLALFVLFEKLVPAGHWLSYLAGIILIGWGGIVLIDAGRL